MPMNFTWEDISNYSVTAFSGPNATFLGADATINLVTKTATVFLNFFPSGMTIPANRHILSQSGKRKIHVNLRYDQFANVLDVLRNEKPVYFWFQDDLMWGYLTTANEPVGEGE